MEGKTEGEEAPKLPEEKVELDEQDVALVEAALYVAGRPLDLKTLASITNMRSRRKAQSIARMLMNEYKRRNTALEVLELEDRRFVMQLKAGYSLRVKRLAVRPLLNVSPLKTLSYIAYRQPVLQKQVVEVRGGHAYTHIKMLKETGWIECRKEGKTPIIRTTEYFADYFGLSHDPKLMKRQLRKIFDNITRSTGAETRAENETIGAR